MSVTSTKRIAKNTLLLYLRMIIVVCVSIFTVRIVMENLGIKDYGIYNVVGGLSSSFIFFQTALTNSTQRFLNYYVGTNNEDCLNKIFNISLEIYVVIAIIIMGLGLTLGTWFVSNKLVIPIESLNDACIVLYATLFSLLLSFIGSTYEAVLISHENMKIYAYLGLFDAIARLIIAYMIIIIPSNKLAFYAIALAVWCIIQKVVMIIYCQRYYKESKLNLTWDCGLFKDIFSFSFWNFYGTGVWMINQQGINIILNLFFGPVINAARGVAFQVTNVVTNFTSNFFVAVKPQIIKSYVTKEHDSMVDLIFFSSRISLLLIWVFMLPIYLRINYVLSLWLKDVPEYTPIFIKWVLVYMLVDTLVNPLWTGIQAVGKLKKCILIGGTVFLLAFPISYMLLKFGYAPWCVYPALIICRCLYLIINFKILNRYIRISLNDYVKKVILPIILIIMGSVSIMFPIDNLFPQNFMSFIMVICLSILTTGILIYFIGLTSLEQLSIKTYIYKLLNKI